MFLIKRPNNTDFLTVFCATNGARAISRPFWYAMISPTLSPAITGAAAGSLYRATTRTPFVPLVLSTVTTNGFSTVATNIQKILVKKIKDNDERLYVNV